MLLSGQDRKLLAAITQLQQTRDRGGAVGRVLHTYAKLRYMFWTIISGSDIHRDARVDSSTRFPHLNGVVIHESAVVEKDCLIMQQVTLGQTAQPGAPHLEAGVYVGAGAKILGTVRIGTGARIGANAVVLTDVPAHCTAVGVPARILNGKENT